MELSGSNGLEMDLDRFEFDENGGLVAKIDIQPMVDEESDMII